jgi:hypothetical protein
MPPVDSKVKAPVFDDRQIGIGGSENWVRLSVKFDEKRSRRSGRKRQVGFFAGCLTFASDDFPVNVDAIARLKIQTCVSPDVLGRNRESIDLLLLWGRLGIQGG